MVAMTPIITIQVLGIISKVKERRVIFADEKDIFVDDSIVELDSDEE